MTAINLMPLSGLGANLVPGKHEGSHRNEH